MSSPSLGFFLFVLCTGVLFVRPTELVESLAGAPLYEVSILGCFAVSVPQVTAQLTARALVRNPITLCVTGLLAAVALSHLSHFAIAEAATSSFAFFKILLSYLLLVAVVSTVRRLQWYLLWLFVFILTLTVFATLHHHGVIDNPALAANAEYVFDKDTGDVVGTTVRLSGAGIFGNPNDLARILVVGIALSLYFADGGTAAWVRPLWLGAIGLFGHTLVLTHSRGGFIALLATLLTLAYFRLGARRALLLAGIALPVGALTLGGRQTELSTAEGTGQQRIQLWSDGLVALRSAPGFGIGMEEYPKITGGLGAHNSYVEAYVELGFFGGTLFSGAVFAALWIGARLNRSRLVPDPKVERVGVYLLATLAGYAAGMLSSSRCYAIPTYELLGLVVVYLRITKADTLLPGFRVTIQSVIRSIILSLLFLALIQFFILSTVQFGVKP
ncbi:MAG: hypothetical protein JWO38_3585 [Gemmataceae bacterium]|nr:hypothetical protein [Gemmataceae bacterium]